MSPSECEVTFSGGGVVSLGFVVAVVWVSEAAAVVSAAVSEVVVEGSRGGGCGGRLRRRCRLGGCDTSFCVGNSERKHC